MKLLICLALFSLSAAQLSGMNGLHEGDEVDDLHGWRLEYHYSGIDHILLFINDHRTNEVGGKQCYVVEVKSEWEALMKDPASVHHITDEIYALITDPNHVESDIRPIDIGTTYHHFDAADECRGHSSHVIDYTPSFA